MQVTAHESWRKTQASLNLSTPERRFNIPNVQRIVLSLYPQHPQLAGFMLTFMYVRETNASFPGFMCWELNMMIKYLTLELLY